MSDVLVDHPDEWIGIPEKFPIGPWSSVTEWATAYADAVFGKARFGRSKTAKSLIEYLVKVADSREEREATRVYVSLDGWPGQTTIVDLDVMSAARAGEGATLESLAGAHDSYAIEPPVVEPFTSTQGLVGVKCTSILKAPDGMVLYCARYAFPTSDGFVKFVNADANREKYDHFAGLAAALAASVIVKD